MILLQFDEYDPTLGLMRFWQQSYPVSVYGGMN